jgi:hypothetical protein
MLRHYLAQTDDHIDQATERLERHSRALQQLQLTGRDTRAAEELLARFGRAIEGLRSDRRAIFDLLEAPRVRRRREEAREPPTGDTTVVRVSDGMFDTFEL